MSDNTDFSISSKTFLGYEFLTWLYFHLEENGWELAIPAFDDDTPDNKVKFSLGSKIVLSHESQGARVAITGPYIDHGGEMFAAVRRGASIQVLQLNMTIASQVYTITIEAKNRKITAKIPDLFTAPTEKDLEKDNDKPEEGPRVGTLPLDAILDVRMACLDELEEVVDILYASFINKRIARQWAKSLSKIQVKVRDQLEERS